MNNLTELQTHCPECQSALIHDVHNGEKICSGCGLVAMEQMSDYGPESRGTNLEDKMKLARATGQTTYSQHDLGIRTEIAIGTKDYSGKTKGEKACQYFIKDRRDVPSTVVVKKCSGDSIYDLQKF